MWASAFWITACTAAESILAFVLQVILAARFGAAEGMDAYWTAASIPLLIIGLLPSAFNICLIPIFVEYTAKGRTNDAFAVSNSVIALLALSLTIFVVSGELTADWIIKLIAPGFEEERSAITSHLFRVLLPSVLCYGIANALGSLYYAQRKPFWPALLPVLRIGSIVVGLIVFPDKGIAVLAWGDLLGAFLGLSILLASYLLAGGCRYWQGLVTPEVKRVMGLLLPWLASFTFGRFIPVVERLLASTLPVGSIAYLGYASQISNLIVTLIAKGLSLSLFPLLSQLAALQNFEVLRATIGRGIRVLLMVVIPVIMLLILYGRSGIAILLERGAFDAVATKRVYLTLIGYLGAFLALPFGAVVTNTFYALHDARTVARVAAWGFAINTLLDFILVGPMGVTGLAVGYSITALVNLVILYSFLVRHIGRVQWWNHDTRVFFVSAGLGGVISWMSVKIGRLIFPPILASSRVALVVMGVLIFCFTCLLFSYVGNNREVRLGVNILCKKIGLALKGADETEGCFSG